MNMLLLRLGGHIASFFSILFGMVILLEVEDPLTRTALSALALFFLVMNEYFKVSALSKKFHGLIKNNALMNGVIVATFIISFALSTLGIYFWVNKTNEKEIAQSEKVQNQRLSIKTHYNAVIDSIGQLSNTSPEYQSVQQDIEFWKTRVCRTSDERKQARENIMRLEAHQRDLEANFKAFIEQKITRCQEMQQEEIRQLEVSDSNFETMLNKDFFVYIIFFTLVAFTEVMIVYIQHQKAQIYTPEQKMHIKVLESLLLLKELDNITTMNLAHNPLFNPSGVDDDNFKQRATAYKYLLGYLGVIEKDKNENGKILNKEGGVKVLKDYYKRTNNVIN